MSVKKFIISLITILSLTITIKASSAKDTLTVYNLDPVVVTGSRVSISKSNLPSSVSIVSNRLIEEQNHVPLLDLVSQNVPNLFVTQRTNIGYGVASGAGGNISIRGAGGSPTNRVLVLIDGRPDLMGIFGHPLGDAYFMHDVKRIEVLRGPSSLLYGSNAMGGAINIITNHEHQEGFHIEIPLRYGSFNTKNSYFRQTYGGQNWGYSLSGGYRDSDGSREKGDDSYTSRSGNLEFNWKPSKNVKVYGNSYISDLNINDPGQISNPFENHWFDLQRLGGDVTFEHKINNFTSKIKIHHNYGHHEIHDANDNPGENANYISDDQTTGLIATETWQYQPKSHLTIGVDFRNYGGEVDMGGPLIEHDVNEYSGMVVFNHNFSNKIIANGGLRYTDHSLAGSELIPAAGVSLLLPNQWRAKVEYSKGYRNPSIKDLYLFMPANKELKPEIMNSYELSIEKNYYDVFTNSISVFYNEMENLIVTGFKNQAPLLQNTGSAEIRGIEIEGQLLLPPDFAINWSGSYSNIPKHIIGSPEKKVNLSLRYRAMQDMFMTLSGEYISGLNSINNPYANPPAYQYTVLDDYFLVNVTTNYSLNENLSFFAKLKNLLDQDYETMAGFPMPGRTYTAGITLKY
ncbi:MAG: TonB-dependent receptor [Candidatus Marinimicrobia bacterium]|nr:TonB-dependent receptor [Candidatus Neomarinimicrobiota bacterium]